jgi:hypothetical protein
MQQQRRGTAGQYRHDSGLGHDNDQGSDDDHGQADHHGGQRAAGALAGRGEVDAVSPSWPI